MRTVLRLLVAVSLCLAALAGCVGAPSPIGVDVPAPEAPDAILVASSNAIEAVRCAPRRALHFVYPVLPTGAVPSAALNTVDPRESGWFVGNCFGNPCGSACSLNATDVYHPGEDFNLIWSRAVVERARATGAALPARTCLSDRATDLGELVYAVGHGVVVDTRRVNAALGDVVVVRHDLAAPEDVRPYRLEGTTIPEAEARVDHVYSVYLHVMDVRPRVGDCVAAGEHIARIANVTNGPHLHFEIVRPSPAFERGVAAGRVYLAGTASGYYPTRQGLTNFGHLQPSKFIREHRLTWHPVGTLVNSRRGTSLLDRAGGRVVTRPVSPDRAAAWRLDLARAVTVSEGEFDCYDPGAPLDAPPRQEIYRVVTSPTVWRVDLDGRFRQPFVSGEAFLSWGYRFPVENSYTFDALRYATWPARDAVRLRDGSLFRTLTDPRVYVVTEGRRRHVADPDVFAALGLTESSIYRVGDGTEDALGGSAGDPITAASLHVCENGRRQRDEADCAMCGGAPTAVDVGGACEPRGETCNGLDDDCDRAVDEDFDLASDPLNCGACGRACAEIERCASARCVSALPDAPDAAVDAGPDAALLPDVAFADAADATPPSDLPVAAMDAGADVACAPTCTPGSLRCDSANVQRRCLAPFGRVIPCATWSEPETCSPGSQCADGAGCRPCGALGQACCASSACAGPLRCVGERCVEPPPSEVCDGLDNNGDGRADELFVCVLGRRGEGCATRCGSGGTRRCVRAGDVCVWSETCEPYAESEGSNCTNGVDDDCDGVVDCAAPACAATPACARRCGDGRCEGTEDCSTCATDCGCAGGTACQAGRCTCPDVDGDGARDARCGGADCNDRDPDVHPGAAERCNGADDTCDGVADEGCRRLRVELTPTAQRECPAGGWQLVVWDPTGREYAPLAAAGEALEFVVPAGWRGMLGYGARCLEASTRWRDWSPYLDRFAPAAGVARVSFDGRDITAVTPVCFPYWVRDANPTWPPSWGTVLLVPLERTLEGACPRRP